MSETEAPSGDTNLAKGFEALDDESYYELHFVTLMRQHFSLTGQLMSEKIANEQYGFEDGEFNELLGRDNVQAQLTEHGVINRPTSVGKQEVDNVRVLKPAKWAKAEGVLTPIQYIVANTMMDLVDTRSYKKKLQDLGISTSTYQTWLQQPAYQEYVKQRAEDMLGENHHEALIAVIDKMRMGDMKAASIYLEMVGRFTPASSTNNGGASSGQIDNLKQIIVSIVEIINDEVDTETAVLISERIKSLIGAQNTATTIVESVIETPTVEPARVLTPGFKEMLKQQGGEV